MQDLSADSSRLSLRHDREVLKLLLAVRVLESFVRPVAKPTKLTEQRKVGIETRKLDEKFSKQSNQLVKGGSCVGDSSTNNHR